MWTVLDNRRLRGQETENGREISRGSPAPLGTRGESSADVFARRS